MRVKWRAGAPAGRRMRRARTSRQHRGRRCRPPARRLRSAALPALPRSVRAEQPALWHDDRCVWIADKFPKARIRCLQLADAGRPLSSEQGAVATCRCACRCCSLPACLPATLGLLAHAPTTLPTARPRARRHGSTGWWWRASGNWRGRWTSLPPTCRCWSTCWWAAWVDGWVVGSCHGRHHTTCGRRGIRVQLPGAGPLPCVLPAPA